MLIATPKEMPGDDKSPVFFECRSNQLFHISVAELKKACDAKTQELQERSGGDEAEFLQQAAQTMAGPDAKKSFNSVRTLYALHGREMDFREIQKQVALRRIHHDEPNGA